VRVPQEQGLYPGLDLTTREACVMALLPEGLISNDIAAPLPFARTVGSTSSGS
jgi:hypothetical protein